MCEKENDSQLTRSLKYIKINEEINLFMSFLNLTQPCLKKLLRRSILFTSDVDYTEFFWEYCIDVGVLFKAFGREQAFITPYYTGAELHKASNRILYPEQSPTHKVVLFPKRKEGAISYDINQIIFWSESDNIVFLCMVPYYREYSKMSNKKYKEYYKMNDEEYTEYWQKNNEDENDFERDREQFLDHGIRCLINEKEHIFAQSDCNMYVTQIDENQILSQKKLSLYDSI